jgi:hypothetical protein
LSGVIVLFVPIVATVVIPNLLTAQRAANKGSASANIRTNAGTEATFMAIQSTDNSGDFQY